VLEKISKAIGKMLSPGDNITVALSGGADSVALLHVLLDAGEYAISAVHVNHNLRGAESERDENFVRELCEKLSVPLQVFQANVNEFAAEKNIGTEEAARKLRYEFLQAASPGKIATAHNQDDNAETVLMNLCRGAGLKGLCGIPPVNGRIIRPLLEVSREEIEAYLSREKIAFITDTTNHSNDYTRNRVRNIILPVLEAEVNPGAKSTIAKNAALLREDEAFLEETARQAFANLNEAGKLNMEKLSALPPAISRRVVRCAVGEVRGGDISNISAAHVGAILGLVHSQTGREIHLPGVAVASEYGFLKFREAITPGQKFRYILHKDIPVYIPEIGKTVLLSEAPLTRHCTKVFNCDKIPLPLYVRTRENGDRITFRRKDGSLFTKKLQDYFTDEKIPKHERNGIALIAFGNEILWIMDKKNRTNAQINAFDKNIKNTGYISVWGDSDNE
jgi:tRNA(Ile)-lysidine synthase